MRKKSAVQLLSLVLPAALFYAGYALWGLLPAMAGSMVVSFSWMAFRLAKGRRISRTQVFGLAGLVLSFVAVLFTGNEKLSFVSGLINNGCLALFAAVLTLRRRSLLHYVLKDFDLSALRAAPEEDFLHLNAVWLGFFTLKVAAKLIGLAALDYRALYWMVFLLGDPMTLLLAGYSIHAVRKRLASKSGPSQTG